MKEKNEEKRPRRRGQVKDLGGGKFRIAVPVGVGAKGERLYHHETIHNSTPSKIEKRIIALLTKADDGTYFEPSRMLLKEAIAMWLERKRRKLKAGKLKPSSLQTYETYSERHLDRKIGDVQLRNLSVTLLQNLIDDLEDGGMKRSAIQLVYVPLKQTLDLMVRLGHLKENPALKVELPEMNEPKKAKVFDEKEVFRFIKAAADDPADFPFLFALVTGMRPCEFIGLEYTHLELAVDENGVERGLCHVVRTIVRLQTGEWYFSSPKTEKGKRPIYFPAFMYHLLMAKKDEHLKNLVRLGKTHQLIFTTPKGEPLNRDRINRKQFKRLLTRAEISSDGRSLYTLRRSAATLSMLLGESTKGISDMLGHSSVEFTQDEYIDVLPVMQRMRSDRLADFLFRTNLAQPDGERLM